MPIAICAGTPGDELKKDQKKKEKRKEWRGVVLGLVYLYCYDYFSLFFFSVWEYGALFRDCGSQFSSLVLAALFPVAVLQILVVDETHLVLK
ncbi:hypothetical protein BGZ63DRAFT_392242 [Mariannaea sp. PMI_226]|nr:hypothetical protein BGZ63DRAFT_392242 [Mariannaea sp. PMI_226]